MFSRMRRYIFTGTLFYAFLFRDVHVSLHDMSKIGLMILLMHLKFCWCILNLAGADFEAKSASAKYMHQQNSAGVHQKTPTLGKHHTTNLVIFEISNMYITS